MTNFEEAYLKTMGHEGGYVNDPADRGGETYKGIARNFHPDWPGWTELDRIKRTRGVHNINLCAGMNNAVQALVRSFYKDLFWDVNRLSEVTHQRIAEEAFDTGVNMGSGVAARFMQEALNLCNNAGRSYPNISVDGVIGPKTLGVLKQADETRVFKTMNLLQGERYLNILRNNESQERFWGGWLNRIIC